MSHVAQAQPKAIARPLYAQVKEMLLARVRSGEWMSGQTLPNEFVLASHYQVSIGTIRRAVEGLEEAGIVVRKQGRGTFVAAPDAAAIRERFSPLRSPSGAPLDLKFRLASVARRRATEEEAMRLELGEDGGIYEIRQVVTASEAVIGSETAVVGAEAFPGLDGRPDLDQHLYVIFASLGMSVTHVKDLVSAVSADAGSARLLRSAPGTLALRIIRTAYSLDGRPLELRNGLYLASRASLRCQTGGTDIGGA